MDDNNYNLEYSTPMNDVPTHEEVLTEKPDYDKISTPTPQPLDKYCQSQSLDDDNLLSDNLQQGNQTIPSENTSDSQANNNNNYHQFECEQPVQVKKKRMEKRHKLALIYFILIILLIAVDIVVEVYGDIFYILLLGDNVAIVVMTIVYLVFIILKKSIENRKLELANIFVLSAGFALKSLGIYLLYKFELENFAAFALIFIVLGKAVLVVFCWIKLSKDQH